MGLKQIMEVTVFSGKISVRSLVIPPWKKKKTLFAVSLASMAVFRTMQELNEYLFNEQINIITEILTQLT